MAHGTIGQDGAAGAMRSVLQSQGGYDAAQKRDSAATTGEYALQGHGIYGQMVEAFCRCIRDGTDPAVGSEQGLHSMKLVEAIYRSARQRRVVEVT
jgi:predicted dehydrogenase